MRPWEPISSPRRHRQRWPDPNLDASNCCYNKQSNPVLTVSFLDPTKNQLFVTSPLNILLTAATSDSSGTITNVQFFNGTNLPGNVTVASSNMWTLLWTDVVAGSYSLTVKASDDAGNTATKVVSITVNAMPWSISLAHKRHTHQFSIFLQTTNVTFLPARPIPTVSSPGCSSIISPICGERSPTPGPMAL